MLRQTRTALAVVAIIALVGWAQPAWADPVNLVTNGSFESGLTGWTYGGTLGDPYPAVAIWYNSATSYPTGAFGEAVPPNDAFTFSPDPVGNRAAYFVSDFASSESLSQSVAVLNSGVYQIGFSSYAPANGYANLYDATFSGVIASVVLANYAVSTGPKTTWQTFSGATNLVAGNYLVEFVFNTNGKPAKDIVIDQVYMIEGNPVIPEPATLVLLGSGMVGLVRWRRRKA